MKPKETNLKAHRGTPTPGGYLAGEGNDDVNQHDQLQWLAFCYVADELTAKERDDFESRLWTDLSAQEALASVVELTSSVHQNHSLQNHSLHPETSPESTTMVERASNRNSVPDRSSTLSRVLLIAAAILVLATIGYGVSQNTVQNTALKNLDEPSIDSEFSADDWINSFGDIAEDQIALEVSEEDTTLVFDDLIENDDLGVDPVLISFYSEVFDGPQDERPFNSKSPNQNPELDL